MIYGKTVKRENAMFDDTCRRDFPLGDSGSTMNNIHRYIIFGLIAFGIISLATFILTLIYILLRHCLPKRSSSSPTVTTKKLPKMVKTKGPNQKPHGYLWHDDMI